MVFDPSKVKMSVNSLYKAMGYSDRELKRPRFIVVNSWSECAPGHIHLDKVSAAVKNGIHAAGGLPIEFNVPGLCIALSQTLSDIRYDLPARDTIASVIEVGVKSSARQAEGVVYIGTCDKMVPAMLMAALRLDLPAIFVPGGPMLKGIYNKEFVSVGAEFRLLYPKLFNGEMTEEEFEKEYLKLENAVGCSAGSCAEMVTGNSMQILAEAMGMTLPGGATAPAVTAERIRLANESGWQIVKLAEKGIRPSQIITRDSLRNAISVDSAVGGGSNTVIHLQALAWEGKIDLTLDDWDAISDDVPCLCEIAPTGPYSVGDLHTAGGVPAVMKRIKEKLSLDCLTVNQQTIGEIITDAEIANADIIKTLDNPVRDRGALSILRGNLAPRGSVIRHTIILDQSIMQCEWNALVFDSLEEAFMAALQSEISEGDAVVVRNEGPRGTPGMNEIVQVIFALELRGYQKIAVITDGRFSGLTRRFPAVASVCPEAAIGGPLAAVKNGDKILLDIPNKRLELMVSEDEIKERLLQWEAPRPRVTEGVATIYSMIAEQADHGAVWNLRL